MIMRSRSLFLSTLKVYREKMVLMKEMGKVPVVEAGPVHLVRVAVLQEAVPAEVEEVVGEEVVEEVEVVQAEVLVILGREGDLKGAINRISREMGVSSSLGMPSHEAR